MSRVGTSPAARTASRHESLKVLDDSLTVQRSGYPLGSLRGQVERVTVTPGLSHALRQRCWEVDVEALAGHASSVALGRHTSPQVTGLASRG